MATNSDGLRQLDEIYSLPKTCTEANIRAARIPEARAVDPEGPFKALQLCWPASKPIPKDIGLGLVRISEGTVGIVTDRKFVLPGGRLVEPYSANSFDMARDGAIEVQRLRFTDPPHTGLEGWLYSGSLGGVGGPPL
jgi:hypothetical protein